MPAASSGCSVAGVGRRSMLARSGSMAPSRKGSCSENQPAIQACPKKFTRGLQVASVEIERVALQLIEAHVVEHALVRTGQVHVRRAACLERLFPAIGAQAPA